MDLGQRLKQARLSAGLSQRQLCGDVITRNMLSQIENGSAKPSMDTLRYLAEQLGKPVSFFLEETVASVNQDLILRSRSAYQKGDFAAALVTLEDFSLPDEVFEAEFYLLQALCHTELAAQDPENATHHLDSAAEAGKHTPYDHPDLLRRRTLLLAQQDPQHLLDLPDEELLLRTKHALASNKTSLCITLLEEASHKDTAQWCLLRGDCAVAMGMPAAAIEFYLQAEDPAAYSRLEQCYLQLEDYKMAYHYACKQR